MIIMIVLECVFLSLVSLDKCLGVQESVPGRLGDWLPERVSARREHSPKCCLERSGGLASAPADGWKHFRKQPPERFLAGDLGEEAMRHPDVGALWRIGPR